MIAKARLLFLYCFLGLAALPLFPLLILRPFDIRNSDFYRLTVLAFARRILGVKVVIEGAENCHPDKLCFYVGNHQHNIDLVIIGPSIPLRTAALGKKAILFFPFFGMIFWLGGNILIDRKNKKSAWDSLIKTSASMKKKLLSVIVFPEGTRNPEKGLLPFKKGVFSMAIQTQLPIIPLVANHYKSNLDLSSWHSGTVTIRFLPEISTLGLDKNDLNALRDRVYQSMNNALIDLDGNS